jgi:hypothetical protein
MGAAEMHRGRPVFACARALGDVAVLRTAMICAFSLQIESYHLVARHALRHCSAASTGFLRLPRKFGASGRQR